MIHASAELAQKIAKRKAVVLVGAGVSAGSANGNQLVTWTAYLRMALTVAKEILPYSNKVGEIAFAPTLPRETQTISWLLRRRSRAN
jgi:hypothetical protein